MPSDKVRIDVFISSTSIDLPEHRAAVRDAILEMGFFPNGMEHWPVSGENPVALCKRMVADADIYLGIYAHRYGWKPGGYDGKSITELEYDWAGAVVRDGKPIPLLCFIMRDDHPWPKDKMELEAEEDLNRFKGKVKANQVGFFTTPDNLKAQVTVALANYLAAKRAQESIRWEPGAAFDHYTLRDVLGTGGNGQVWLADQHLPDGTTRPVAIKVLRSGISENPTRVERFKREISTMARIDHAHIVRIYDYGDRSGQLHVIMPYFSGGTLRAQMAGKPLDEVVALRWLEQIGAALDYVHDRDSKLIHRDVKPENILIGEDGETLYLADFGLVFSSDGTDRFTDDGQPVGTGRYMAPEQWRDQPLSRHTDLYALGILAYELLTGHLPFQHKNDLDLGNAHCEEPLPPDPALPDEVLRILRRMAAKNPDDRYPTARAFLTDLRNWRVDPANIEPRIRDYLNWVTDELYDGLRALFVELAGDETTRYPLPSPGTPTMQDDEDDLFARASARVYAHHVKPDETGSGEFVENVRERLLELEQAVLIGEPGSGKTWMLQRLQADYARSWLKSAGQRPLIPVLVRLNHYTGGEFTDFVKTALDTLAPYHDELLREKRLLLLCDALNEMPRRAGQMQKLVQYLKGAPYFVVSCRARDYNDDLGDLKPLEQVLLRDLELPAIRELVHKRLPDGMGQSLWQQMGGTDALFDFWQKAQDANAGKAFWDAKTDWWEVLDFYSEPRDWHEMHSGARLIPLARNPYMGDLLCHTYHESGGTLPSSRAELFGRFIAQMLGREAKAAARRGEVFPDVDDIQAVLVALAQALQDAGLTVITQADALKAVAHPDAEALLRAALDANILSIQDGDLRFAHQLLQEYFAARILLEKLEADETAGGQQRALELFGTDWWDAGVWRETTVILGEFLGEGARGANRVARWLAAVTPEVALQVVTRSAAGLTLADLEPETRTALIAGAHERTKEVDPRGRAAAYRVLNLLDADTRPGVGAVIRDGVKQPDIKWSESILPGDYPIGGDKEAYNTLPAETYPLEYSYQVSKYPVTYAQFQVFLDAADGYSSTNHNWFKDMAADDKHKQMDEQRFKYNSHPRETVNWYQALAFCRWLSWRLTNRFYELDEIAAWPVRLPTEKEWEIAARGPEGRIYPYAGEFDAAKGNTDETGIRQTSAVGIFPAGVSWCGAEELSGNVWEWCINPDAAPDGGLKPEHLRSSAVRVLRGGSWLYNHCDARAASRLSNLPVYRGTALSGFGCVVCPICENLNTEGVNARRAEGRSPLYFARSANQKFRKCGILNSGASLRGAPAGTGCGCCAAARGTTIITMRAPRTATTTIRTTVTTISGFGCVVCHTYCPFPKAAGISLLRDGAVCALCPASRNAHRPRFVGRGGKAINGADASRLHGCIKRRQAYTQTGEPPREINLSEVLHLPGSA